MYAMTCQICVERAPRRVAHSVRGCPGTLKGRVSRPRAPHQVELVGDEHEEEHVRHHDECEGVRQARPVRADDALHRKLRNTEKQSRVVSRRAGASQGARQPRVQQQRVLRREKSIIPRVARPGMPPCSAQRGNSRSTHRSGCCATRTEGWCCPPSPAPSQQEDQRHGHFLARLPCRLRRHRVRQTRQRQRSQRSRSAACPHQPPAARADRDHLEHHQHDALPQPRRQRSPCWRSAVARVPFCECGSRVHRRADTVASANPQRWWYLQQLYCAKS